MNLAFLANFYAEDMIRSGIEWLRQRQTPIGPDRHRYQQCKHAAHL